MSDKIKNWNECVEKAVRELEYGVVQITVHQGKVVQVDKTERQRFSLRETDSLEGDTKFSRD